MSDIAVMDRLIEAGIGEREAKVITLELVHRDSRLATKDDLSKVRDELSKVRDELKADIDSMKREIAEVKEDVKNNGRAIGGLKTTLIIGLFGFIAAIMASPWLERLLS